MEGTHPMYYDKRWDRPLEVTPLQPPEKWRLILRKAAAMFEGDARWVQGCFHDGGDAYCAVGAINVAAGFNPADGKFTNDLRRVYAALAKQIGHAGLSGSGFIWGWNDSPGRTKGQVIPTLRSAAEQ